MLYEYVFILNKGETKLTREKHLHAHIENDMIIGLNGQKTLSVSEYFRCWRMQSISAGGGTWAIFLQEDDDIKKYLPIVLRMARTRIYTEIKRLNELNSLITRRKKDV